MLKSMMVSSLALLLALPAQSEEIRSVHIWHEAGTAPVSIDVVLKSAPQIIAFDLSEIRRLEDATSQAIMAKVEPTDDPDEYKRRAIAAGQAYFATGGMNQFKAQMDNYLIAANAALKYRIPKVPAILINERYLVTGEHTLSFAIAKFEQEVGQ